MYRLGVDSSAGGVRFDELSKRYAEPSRHYHTLDHVGAMLDIIEAHQFDLDDCPSVELAAWFHDSIYDPHRHDNEEESAELAVRALADFKLPSATAARVDELILLTKRHFSFDIDTDANWLIDADLAILGSDPAGYRTYSAAIRCEYQWVEEAAWRSGRRAVLESLLSRHRIYGTREMRDKFEAFARRNMADEISSLAG